jgi:hypothetical protein
MIGMEHPDTLTNMGNLAAVMSKLKRWKEVEELEVHVLETMKKTLGHEHPSTLTRMNNLASGF